MSSTRRSADPSKFHQNRFASSREFDRGLMANLVARRASLLETAADRGLIWFLQSQSHQAGGTKKIAAELIASFPHRIATPAMQRFGVKAGQIYSASQVESVRDEISGSSGQFPLRGEFDFCEPAAAALLADYERTSKALFGRAAQEADGYPESYPAADFLACCQSAAADHLEKQLMTLCLDPAMPVADGEPWYFPTLISTLREYMAARIAAHCQRCVVTTLGQKVHEALDYTDQTGSMTLIEGSARFGKTHSVMDWCARHPGRARYVQLESSQDEISFFRAIAKSLGVSINLNSKSQDLRQRVEETLQAGGLMLVLDEAHYLWPSLIDSRTLPNRINWLLTALVNKGVPVALVTTPQFLRNQSQFETRTRWTSEQLTGRIGYYEKLPDRLPEADLRKVATVLAPDADDQIIGALVAYAQTSVKYLAGIRAVVERAGFIASKDGRQKIQASDVRRALKESVMPSDSAFSAAVQASEKPARRRAIRVSASALEEPLQPDFSRTERPLQAPDLLVNRSGSRAVGAELVH